MSLHLSLAGTANPPLSMHFVTSHGRAKFYSFQEAVNNTLFDKDFRYSNEATTLYAGWSASTPSAYGAISSGGCLVNGTEDCGQVCRRSTVFHDPTTLHNCVVYWRTEMSRRLLNLTITMSPESADVAQQHGFMDATDQSPNAMPGSQDPAESFISTCLADYCWWKYNQRDCNATGMAVLGPVFPAANTTLQPLNIFNICDRIDADINTDIGGIGVCPTSYRDERQKTDMSRHSWPTGYR